jgi:hypothetical protein
MIKIDDVVSQLYKSKTLEKREGKGRSSTGGKLLSYRLELWKMTIFKEL